MKRCNFFQKYLLLIACLVIPFQGLSVERKTAKLNVAKPFSISMDEVAKTVNSIASSTQLSEIQKQSIQEIWRKISENIPLLHEWQQKYNDLKQKNLGSTQTLERLQKELEKNTPSYKITPYEDKSIEEIASLYKSQSLLFESYKEKIAELEAALSSMSAEHNEAPLKLVEIKKQLEQTKDEAAANADTIKELSDARTALLTIQSQILKLKETYYEVELLSYEKRFMQAKLQKELLMRTSKEVKAYLDVLQKHISSQKKLEAHKETQEAKKQVEGLTLALPKVKMLAEQNTAYTKDRTLVLEMTDKVAKEIEIDKKVLDKLLSDKLILERKIASVDYSDTMGMLFRLKRKELPDPSIYREKLRSRQNEIQFIQRKLFSLEDESLKLLDIQAVKADFIADLNFEKNDSKKDVEEQVEQLFQMRRTLIKNLIHDSRALLGKLIELKAIDEHLLDTIRQSEIFINENIFWIPSSSVITIQDIPNAYNGFKHFFAVSYWTKLGYDITVSIKQNLLFYLFLIAITLSILFLRAKNSDVSNEIEKRGIASKTIFSDTIKCILLNLLATIPLPLWLLILSAVFRDVGSTQGRTMGIIIFKISLISWFILFLRKSLKPDGLVSNHFQWRIDNVLEMLRRRFSLILILIMPLFFLCSVALSSKIVTVSESLGRLLFIAMALITAFIMHPITAPSGKLFSQINKGSGENLVYRFRHFVYFSGTLFPAILAILASFGYVFTAHSLYLKNANSLAIAIVGIYAYAVMFRLILLQRRQLAILKSKELQAANKADVTKTNAAVGISPADSEQPTIFSISNQANNVIIALIIFAIGLGIWGIWRDVLPAVKLFGQFELWTTDARVATVKTSLDGTSSKQFIDKIIPITLADLLFSIAILIFTFWSANNIQGFLQFVVLQRLTIDQSIRFAASTLVKYMLMLFGVVVSFQTIGLGWSKLQWLVTGVSVGLGFGLQEIFANFISGLIILFERPLRVGDFIQIDSHLGTVTHIQIRATTLLLVGGKEVIIPNKDLITGSIINWTLSNSSFRLDLPVGVSYSSDIQKVEKVLLEIADNNPEILQEPAPVVVHMGFGDSSINYQLRIYIDSPSSWISVMTGTNKLITEAFRQNKIEIPFPQMDLHVKKESDKVTTVKP